MNAGMRTSSLILACAAASAIRLEAQTLQIPDSLPPGVTPVMVQRGKVLFEGPAQCAACHGRDARGLLGPDLTDSEWWHAKGTYLAILQRILNGVPRSQSVTGNVMNPRGGASITDEEVQSVAAYIWSLSHPEARDSLPIGVTRHMIDLGRDIFRGRGLCHTCHGENAAGNIGPNLTGDEWLHTKGSYLSIVAQVLSGTPASLSRTGVMMPPRGGANLSDADVHAVAAYVWVLSHPGH